ncbi:hypothetical protein MTR67_011248, partial [Solanum verrucosum]
MSSVLLSFVLCFLLMQRMSLGSLYHVLPEAEEEEIEVNTFAGMEEWNIHERRDCMPEEYVQHIIRNIPPPDINSDIDQAKWMLETTGRFSVKSAWGYIRLKEEKEDIFKHMWINKLP